MSNPSVVSLNEPAVQLAERYKKIPRPSELYGPGAEVYEDLAAVDTSEISEVLAIADRVDPDRGAGVLDLAAGSGRITLPLLTAGHRVTALDLSPDMLRLLVAKAVTESLDVIEADMTTFTTPERFGLVVLGTTSLSLLSDDARREMMRTVAEYVPEGGTFVLTTVVEGDLAARDIALVTVGSSGESYALTETWVAGAGYRDVAIVRVAELANGDESEVPFYTSRIAVVPEEILIDELAAAGFTVVDTSVISPPAARHRHLVIEAVRAG